MSANLTCPYEWRRLEKTDVGGSFRFVERRHAQDVLERVLVYFNRYI